MRGLFLVALLLAALPAAARVVDVAPGAAAEQGGTPAPDQAGRCTCAAAFPFGPFGWFGGADTELMLRWSAVSRAAFEADRARWRAARIAGRPRVFVAPRALWPRR